MRYLISRILHPCEYPGSDVWWDRGKWYIGIGAIQGKRPKCPKCHKILGDPTQSNHIFTSPWEWRNNALNKDVEYTAILIEKVDKRKKKYKKILEDRGY